MKKGDIVKVIRPDVGFMGLTSELAKDPRAMSFQGQYCFRLLYNSVSVDKSPVRSFYGSDQVQFATEGEKALYKFMKSLDISEIIYSKILAKPLYSDKNDTWIIKKNCLNMYNGSIYVFADNIRPTSDICEGWVELYNGRFGSWASGVPVDFENKFIIDTVGVLCTKDCLFVPRLKGPAIVQSTPKGVHHWNGQFDQQDIGMDPSILLL